MEEYIKDKLEGKKPESAIRQGGGGFTPAPKSLNKKKKDVTTFFLFLAVIFIIFSLWVLISIGSGKIPDFLTRFF